MVTVVLILAAIVAAVLLYVNRTKITGNSKKDSSDQAVKFHAVSIRPGMSSCHNVRKMNGTRFLSAEAPLLPLPGCSEDQCTCHFVHYQDRRDGDDRRLPFQSQTGIAGTAKEFERRLRGDRRDCGDDESPLFN